MAFVNDAEFQDDFRKVGQDAIAGFEPAGTASNPTEYASSENVEVAGADDDDLEDDEDVDKDEDTEPDDEDLEDEDEDEDADDVADEDSDDEDEDDDEDYDEDEDEDEEEDPEEEGDSAVMARLGDAEKTARAR